MTRVTSCCGLTFPSSIPTKSIEEFRDASYAKRYELLCLKLVREGLYDSAAFVLSGREGGLKGRYREPNEEIAFKAFAASLVGRVSAAL